MSGIKLPNDSKGIVTIISDDGDFHTGENFNEITKKYGLKVSIAGVVEWIKPHEDEWKDIISEGRVELINHSYSHIHLGDMGIDINENVLFKEMIESKAYYEDAFGIVQSTFVFPGNDLNEYSQNYAKENGYIAIRGGNRGFNSVCPREGNMPGQWMNLYCMGIRDEGVDNEVRNSWVDKAASEGLWLIEMWHNLRRTPNDGYQAMLVSESEPHLQHLSSKVSSGEIWNATFSECVKCLKGDARCVMTI